jgi:hypothetical protein
MASTAAWSAAKPPPFRDAHDFEREDTFQQPLRRNGTDFRHPSTLYRYSIRIGRLALV